MLKQSEVNRLDKMLIFEKRLQQEGFLKVAGIDEAGRGPLAGPVVAAACILPEGTYFEHLNDSKKLKSKEREALYEKITQSPGLVYGIGIIDVETIDSVNILQATFLAMRAAFASLEIDPDYLLIDGNQCPYFEIPSECIVRGDGEVAAIAAASIIAKVTRDRIMEEEDIKFPEYGFRGHKGYATGAHIKAILKYGPSPIHRKSFEPVKSMLIPKMTQSDFLL